MKNCLSEQQFALRASFAPETESAELTAIACSGICCLTCLPSSLCLLPAAWLFYLLHTCRLNCKVDQPSLMLANNFPPITASSRLLSSHSASLQPFFVIEFCLVPAHSFAQQAWPVYCRQADGWSNLCSGLQPCLAANLALMPGL